MRASLLILALAAFPALAHDDATLDKMAAPHGGQIRMAGAWHFELVVVKNSKEARDNPVLVYLTDHGDKKQPSQGYKGTVTLLSPQGKAVATLVPDGENRLRGSASYASNPDLKAVVSITAPDGRTEQARFEPLKAAAAPAAGPGGAHAGH